MAHLVHESFPHAQENLGELLFDVKIFLRKLGTLRQSLNKNKKYSRIFTYFA